MGSSQGMYLTSTIRDVCVDCATGGKPSHDEAKMVRMLSSLKDTTVPQTVSKVVLRTCCRAVQSTNLHSVLRSHFPRLATPTTLKSAYVPANGRLR